MSLRPVAAKWFELVTVHTELARVMECLSHTGAVELEASSRATDRLQFPGMADELKAHREFARHYQNYWPAPAAADRRRPEQLSETLNFARERLAAWAAAADPLIAASEKLARETADLGELRTALAGTVDSWPDLQLLSSAGPKLQVRLLALPAGTLLREIPALVLFKSWLTPQTNYVLVVGRSDDVAEIETQLAGLKGRMVPLAAWLPPKADKALAAIDERLAALAEERAEVTAQLAALSQKHAIASALGDIALIEWLNEHAKDLSGSERLVWVTGWTSDITGTALRRALDASGVRYILRYAEAPAGMSPPLVLHNPGWARAFEIFARMLGTPGRNESDPSEILAVIASLIFGFMFGDVGQGAVVFAAGLALARRVPLTRLLIPGGLMAMVFGVLFGSVFCREDIIPALWMRPLTEPITMLAVGIAAGVVVITIGLVLDAIQMHWRGEAAQWWAHRAGLFVAYAGLLGAPFRREALLVAGLGAAWFMFGAALLAKQARFSALTSAAAELVEEALRLLVNTVSFARVGAFALAHAGLSVAVLEMAAASGRYGYWLVLVVGNVVMIALEGVVVSIQTTRLLLFEFFIRFLTGAGREFKPLPPPLIMQTAIAEPNLRDPV
jgi:V/A-type H+/Na+-transporting ATPase subunit I